MKVDPKNSFPSICEIIPYIELFSDKGNEYINIKCEVRLSEDDIENEDLIYRIGLRRLYLKLGLDGFIIVPGTRYGEPTNSEEKVFSSTQMRGQTSAGIDASLSAVNVPMLTASAKIGGEITKDVKMESVRDVCYQKVKARGDNTWEITNDIEFSILNGTYLIGETVCTLQAVDGSNLRQISVMGLVKKSDISVQIDDGAFFKKIGRNKKKIIEIIAAKHLTHDLVVDTRAGRVCVSLSVMNDA